MGASNVRDAILATDDIPREPVEVPEWKAALNGTPLYLRGLTADEATEFFRFLNEEERDQTDVAARLVAKTLVTEGDEPVFTEDDIPVLRKRAAVVLTRLFQKAASLSAITTEAGEEKAQDFDDAQNEGSSSG